MRTAHNFKDLTSQVFNNLTVIERAENSKSGQSMWRCVCICGKEVIALAVNLKIGDVKSCGCIRKYDPKIGNIPKRVNKMAGEKFGILTVVGLSKDRMYGDITWDCKCECGEIVNATRASLLRGYRTSCGCDGKSSLIGMRFEKLLVISRIQKRRFTLWECKCDCGKSVELKRDRLESGLNKSCGCLKRKSGGQSLTPEYQAYNSMMFRCRSDGKSSHRYKKRGIDVCDRWRNSVLDFLADMGPRPSEKHSIDRINNDLGYFPENCRWTTAKEQARNRHTNAMVEMDGKTQCLAAWAEEYKIGYGTIAARLRKGWSSYDAITTPVLRANK